MKLLDSISDEPKQELLLPLSTGEAARLTLRYSSNLNWWLMDVEYKDKCIRSRRVVSSPNLLRQWKNIFPFGIACYTLDNTEPYFLDDFKEGRCGLLLLSAEEVTVFEDYLSESKNEAE